MRESVVALIGLGANLGDAPKRLSWAAAQLGALPESRCVARSHLYRSAPVQASGPDFWNAVLALETRLSAPDLLRAMQCIEQVAGRERPYRHAPRTLDLDLLHYGSGRIESQNLTLPHPRWRERAFVLLPLQEVAPERVRADDLAGVQEQAIERLGALPY